MRNEFTDSSRFWVIFDTCQLAEYYLDVHKLLALPAGSIIRYDYHSQYISDEALAVLNGNPDKPSEVLLIYVQHVGYRRGNGPEYQPVAGEEVLAIGTRLARMRLAPDIGGQRYAFDLEVQGYPKLNPDAINRILEPLIQKSETPWCKWVSISNMNDEMAKLRSGKDTDNWVDIATRLQTRPSQFEGDVFWCLAPPLLDGEKILAPAYESQSAKAPGGMRQISFSFPLVEGHRYEFEVFSHSTYRPIRQLQLSVPDGGPLEIDGPKVINLRYDAATRFTVKGLRVETLFDRSGTLTLSSGATVNDWPIGPQLDLQFKVTKSKLNIASGVILLLLAVVFGFVADNVWKDSLTWGIVCVTVCAACVLVGSAILYGKIAVKL